MTTIALIHAENSNTVFGQRVIQLTDWLKSHNFAFVDVQKEDFIVSHSIDSFDCALVILNVNTIGSDGCRDWWRDTLISQKPLFILASQVEVSGWGLYDIPYHLRGLPYFDWDNTATPDLLKHCLAKRTLEPKHHDAIYHLRTEDPSQPFVESLSPIAQVQNLRRAWLKAWNFAKTDATYFDELSFDLYHEHLDANLLILSDKLQKQEFELQPLFRITVPKQSPEKAEITNKEPETRYLYFAMPETSIVLQAICDLIAPEIEQILDLSLGNVSTPAQQVDHLRVTYANRFVIGKPESIEIFHHWRQSHAKFRKEIKDFAIKNPNTKYFRTDIRKYYPSIDTAKLMEMLEEYVTDEYVLKILRDFLDLSATNDIGQITEVEGIPAGIPLAHLLGNLYLHEVDRQIAHRCLRYFRYVDDVFFFVEDEKDLLDLKSYFATILADMNLEIHLESENPNKTFTGDARDVEQLDAVIDKLSPFLNLDFIDFPEGPQKDIIGQFLYDALIAVEGFDDETIDEINETYAKYAALAVHKLDEIKFQDDLSDIVYIFLNKAPLRSRTIRWLLDYLISRIISYPDELERFQLFLHEHSTSEYVTLAFLQAARTHTDLPDHISRFIQEFVQHKSGVIAGEALYTLSSLELENVEQHIVLLDRISIRLTEETSTYFRLRALWYLLKKDSEQQILQSNIQIFIVSENAQEQHLAYWGLGTLVGIEFSEYLFDENAETLQIVDFSLVGLISWARRLLQTYRDFEIRLRIIDIVRVKSTIVSPQTQADLFASLLGSTMTIDEAETLQNPIFSSQQARLKLEEQGRHNGNVFYFDRFQKIAVNNRLENPQRHDYLCIKVEWNGRKGFLEIIRDKLLGSRGFTTFEAWQKYLNELENYRVIQLVDVRDLGNGNIAVVYEIPRGFMTLSQYFDDLTASTGNNTFNPFAVNQIISILEKINSKVAYTHSDIWGDFRFVTVHSEFVLWSPDLDIYFACIGASLDNTPRYLVAPANLPADQLGIYDAYAGLEAYSLFLGYLLFELLTQKNPIEVQQILKSQRSDRKYLSDYELLDPFVAHIKGFIGRAANTNPKYRYKDYDTLATDLQHIEAFLDYLTRHESEVTEDTVLVLEFVDYLRFRVQAHKRNPEIASQSSEHRIGSLVQAISKDFTRFAPLNSRKREWLEQKYSQFGQPDFLTPPIWDWISVSSKKFLKIVALWEIFVNEYEAVLEIDHQLDTDILSIALSAHAVAIERTAYVQTLARWSGNHCQKPSISSEDFNNAIYFATDAPYIPGRHTSFDFPDLDCETVLTAVQELYLPGERNCFHASRKLISVSPMALFNLLMSHTLTILDENQNVLWTPQTTTSSGSELDWRLNVTLNLMTFEENLLMVFPNADTEDELKSGDKSPTAFFTEEAEIQQEFDVNAIRRLLPEILDCFLNAHCGERLPARIIVYRPKLNDNSEGTLKYALNGKEFPSQAFNEKDLVDRQKTISLPPNGASATLDIYRVEGSEKPHIGAIIVNPANQFELFTPFDTSEFTATGNGEQPMRDQIFISYAHRDSQWLEELQEHLSPLVRHGAIPKPWSDEVIKTGEKWKQAIDEALAHAKVAILLVSPSFLASDFIAEEELKPIYDANERGDLVIFAVAIRASNYRYDAHLSSVQWANDPNKPIARLPNGTDRDPEWVAVVQEIDRVFHS